MKIRIYEVLGKVCDIKNREERISYFKEHGDNFGIKTILQLCYNDKVVLDLPKGKPPFEECPEGRYPSTLKNAIAPISKCVKENGISRLQKEKFFINILESVHPEDAAIICAAKDGTLMNLQNKKYRKITKALVQATFPDLI